MPQTHLLLLHRPLHPDSTFQVVHEEEGDEEEDIAANTSSSSSSSFCAMCLQTPPLAGQAVDDEEEDDAANTSSSSSSSSRVQLAQSVSTISTMGKVRQFWAQLALLQLPLCATSSVQCICAVFGVPCAACVPRLAAGQFCAQRAM